MRNALLPVAALSLLLGCASKPVVTAACPPTLTVSPTDPRVVALLARTELALEEATRALAAPRNDLASELSAQRLEIVAAVDALAEQEVALRARIDRAERALRKGAQSEAERALIAEALADLAADRAIERPVSARVAAREAWSDAVSAHDMLSKNRSARATLDAQLRGIDATFAKQRAPKPDIAPASVRERRPIDPSL